jgi:hypothetical protein
VTTSRDAIVLGAVVAAFAALVTAHVTIAIGLARRRPRWRALVALVVPPLAPAWALSGRMTVRGVVWIASALGYLVALALAR